MERTLDFFPFLGLTSSSGHSSSPATWKVGSSETGPAEPSKSSSSSTAGTFFPFFLSFFLPDFLMAPYKIVKETRLKVSSTFSPSSRRAKRLYSTYHQTSSSSSSFLIVISSSLLSSQSSEP